MITIIRLRVFREGKLCILFQQPNDASYLMNFVCICRQSLAR